MLLQLFDSKEMKVLSSYSVSAVRCLDGILMRTVRVIFCACISVVIEHLNKRSR